MLLAWIKGLDTRAWPSASDKLVPVLPRESWVCGNRLSFWSPCKPTKHQNHRPDGSGHRPCEREAVPALLPEGGPRPQLRVEEKVLGVSVGREFALDGLMDGLRLMDWMDGSLMDAWSDRGIRHYSAVPFAITLAPQKFHSHHPGQLPVSPLASMRAPLGFTGDAKDLFHRLKPDAGKHFFPFLPFRVSCFTSFLALLENFLACQPASLPSLPSSLPSLISSLHGQAAA